MNRYEIIASLGKGAFAITYLGVDKVTGDQVAIKMISKERLKSPAWQVHAEKEYIIPKYLGCEHKNIICVIKRLSTAKYIWIISQYVQNAISLERFQLPDSINDTLLDIMWQLADGLSFMHSKGIMHGDIKPANIVMKGNIPMYIDFDLSCTFETDLQISFPCPDTRFGSPLFSAPELFKKGLNRDFPKIDVYALGIVYFWLVNNKEFPYNYKNMEYDDYVLEVLTNDPEKSSSGMEVLDKLIDQMLTRDWNNRPNTETIKTILSKIIKSQ